ncbi:MAG TPA: hypothetical protein VNO21_08495, partial [Polyangiaceae bacterium]|nr:hypothetical protein [Polyangiaceae bacterium]
TEGTATYNPIVLAPGATGTITLTMTPDPSQVGNTVKGVVYVDTLNAFDLNANYGAGDEVARLPYAYTIVK